MNGLSRLPFLHYRRPLTSLYLTTSILFFGLGMVGIFIPVYIFRLTGNFLYLPAFYAFVSVCALGSILFGTALLSRLGFRRAVFLSSIFRVLNLAFLLLAARYGFNLIFIAAFFEGLTVPTFWVTYHAIFTRSGQDGTYGREVAGMGVFVSTVSALAPLLGGLVVSLFGFPALYGLGMAVILLAVLPILRVRDDLGLRAVGAKEILRETFSPGWRRFRRGFLGIQMEGAVAAMVWPLYLFGVLQSFTGLGALASVFTVVGVTMMVVAGRRVDSAGPRQSFLMGAYFLVPFWILVGFFSNGLALIALNAYRGILSPFFGIGAESFFYSAARADPFLSVLKREVSIHAAILFSSVLVGILGYLFPANWPILFLPAAAGLLIATAMVKEK